MSTVGVIVLSFNRPRMLPEALNSIHGADEIWLTDDGSEFDVHGLAADFGISPERVLCGPKLTPEARLRRSSCGKLLNQALSAIGTDYVAYLCDDDLFAPGWLRAAAAVLDSDRPSHLVRGDWRTFQDGERPGTGPFCRPDFPHFLTTGNFMQRAECGRGCDCWWPEDSVTCHDARFLMAYLHRHATEDVRHVGVLAGWRRLHATNMLLWTVSDGSRYVAGTEALFAGGMLD